MKARLITSIFSFLFFISFCRPQTLKSGDLLFVIDGNSSFSNAISNATSFEDSLCFVHVGILEIDSNNNHKVIEASPRAGVRCIDLKSFLNEAPKIDDKPGVVVKRLTIDFPLQETLTRAKKHLGEAYDWWYMPNNGKMYCSELIYDSYFDKNGCRIFKAEPMNFRSKDGTMPEFWTKLFKELGEPIPEGVAGTNPNKMSKDSNLLETFRFF